MMIEKRLTHVLLLAAVALAGCSGGDDGLKPEIQQQLNGVSKAATTTDGNFDKLSPEDKQKFLKMANGDEKAARAMLNNIAHPPRYGGPGGPGGTGAPMAPGQTPAASKGN